VVPLPIFATLVDLLASGREGQLLTSVMSADLLASSKMVLPLIFVMSADLLASSKMALPLIFVTRVGPLASSRMVQPPIFAIRAGPAHLKGALSGNESSSHAASAVADVGLAAITIIRAGRAVRVRSASTLTGSVNIRHLIIPMRKSSLAGHDLKATTNILLTTSALIHAGRRDRAGGLSSMSHVCQMAEH
jgi:hypothetical protein